VEFACAIRRRSAYSVRATPTNFRDFTAWELLGLVGVPGVGSAISAVDEPGDVGQASLHLFQAMKRDGGALGRALFDSERRGVRGGARSQAVFTASSAAAGPVPLRLAGGPPCDSVCGELLLFAP
jgi:hypothetical protein